MIALRNKDLSSDSYNTDQNYHRAILDKLSFGTSSYFLMRLLSLVLRSRKLARAGKYDRSTWVSTSEDVFGLIEDCGGKFHIEGLENISKSSEAVVFISNHMSMLESMIFPVLIASKREVTFVVKRSLTTQRLFGPVMRAREPITVERQDPIADFKKVISEGPRVLENKTSVVIFPQSRRMVEFDPKQFNSLGIKLAKKANASIVPVAIKTDFWKNGKTFKDVGGINRKLPIHIKFGEPISIEGPGKKEHQIIIDFITENLKLWGVGKS